MTIDNNAERLHAAYLRLTGLTLPFRASFRFMWEMYLLDYGESELELAVKYLQRLIKSGQRKPECLRMSVLIGDLSNFDEVLSMARARQREVQPNPGKASVLKATGRPVQPLSNITRTAADIIKGMEEFEKFKALKEQL